MRAGFRTSVQDGTIRSIVRASCSVKYDSSACSGPYCEHVRMKSEHTQHEA